MPGTVGCGGTPTNCGTDVRIVTNAPAAWGADDPDNPGGIWWRGGSSEGLTFRADDGEHGFYVPDTDWVSIGARLVQPGEDAALEDVRMGVFVHGSDPFHYASATDLDGEATHVGDAVGRWTEREGEAAAAAGAGRFTATAGFEFDFDDEEVGGSITDFKLDRASESESWIPSFPRDENLATLLETDGSTAGSGGPATLGGTAAGSVMEGQLNMRMFGPNTETTTKPTAVAGTFFAQGERTNVHKLSLIDAYAAGPEPAADE